MALIITIIVLLILSVVSVQLITKSGIIEKAKLATLKHEIAKYDEELKLYIVAHREEVNKSPINTSGYENMKKYIPSFKKKYEDKLKISNNKLVYMNDNVSDAERKIFDNAGIGSDEMTQIYYLDENNKEQVLEINDAAISETSYTSKNIAEEKITKVIIGSSCTKIEKNAFQNCTSITSITADTTNQVAIGTAAFANCTNLTNIKISNCYFGPDYVTGYFSNCPNLTSAELGSKEHLITTYIVNPFTGCTNKELIIKIYMDKDDKYYDRLDNLKRSNNATIIAYDSNGNETSIIIGLKYKGTDIAWESLSEFEGIQNTDKITETRDGAFEDCKELKITKLPANLVTIGSSAFKGCKNIKISEIPNNVTFIGKSAFQNCTSITSITADTKNKVSIRGGAFDNCTNLINIKISNCYFGVSTNGTEYFSNCPNLISAELGSKEHLIDDYIVSPFKGCTNEKLIIKIYMDKDDKYYDRLDNLKRSNNATIIAYDSNGNETSIIIGLKYKGTDIAWESLSEFEEIQNADKITEIRDGAFEDCKELKITKLPANLVTIGRSAFKDCKNIKISEIPNNVTSIGKSAFQNCTSITSITADTTNQVAIGTAVFANCTNLTNIKISNCYFGPGFVIEYFSNCPNLTSAELGSKEHLITTYIVNPFTGCTNKELIIKIYMDKDDKYYDRLDNLKRGNNATIIAYDSNGEQIN